jgi:hypothetical protein
MPAFGRREAPDVRDRAFPMRLRLDLLRAMFFPQGLPVGSRQYPPGPILDQLSTGTCVGHGWTSRANGAPIMQKVPFTPYALYRRMVAIDEWTDNDHEALAADDQLQSGTSVRAGAKVLQALGFIANYLWAESVSDVRGWHLAGYGSVVLGVNWTSHMMQTDSQGFVSYTGSSVGGHCVVTTGWNDRVRHNGRIVPAVRCQNSWGRSWGQNGRFWIEESDLIKLLQDQGEACAPTEVKVQPLPQVPPTSQGPV